jgi:hypothetical protein
MKINTYVAILIIAWATIVIAAVSDVHTIHHCKSDGKPYGWQLPISIGLLLGCFAIVGYMAGFTDGKE